MYEMDFIRNVQTIYVEVRWFYAGVMLAHRLRRSANITPAYGHRVLFTDSVRGNDQLNDALSTHAIK